MPEDISTLPRLLWVDLRLKSTPSSLASRFSDACHVYLETRASVIADTIQAIIPQILCFDYDYPDRHGLQALREVRDLHPFLPVLMLTEQHSEALAIWALRTGVWDYLVKPFPDAELRTRIEYLASSGSNDGCHRLLFFPPCIPAELCRGDRLNKPKRTTPAVSYVEAHYQERILLEHVAPLCDMDTFQFSRTFRQEQNITFREYLNRYRIRQSELLLSNPHSTVMEVALAVGFGDPSQFARLFLRYRGTRPSEYRLRRRTG